MERRIAKVNISCAGGTAGSGAKTCKVTLPNSWLDAMQIDRGRRKLELAFDGNKIIMSPHLTGADFTARKLEQKHDVRRFLFYDGDILCSSIHADFTDETLTSQNHINDPVKTAFGNNPLPSWEDFQAFLEERCIPRGRAGLREYLETVGVDVYDPMEIIGKTAGRMAEDGQWLSVEKLK